MLGATKEGSLLNAIGDSASKICSGLCTYYVCTALVNLADQLGDAAVSAKGKTVRAMLLAVWCASTVLGILSDILQRSTALATVAAVIAIVASIVEIIAYILYLGLLKRSRDMLGA